MTIKELQKVAKGFFLKLFSENEHWRLTLDDLDFLCSDDTDRKRLEHFFSEEEILEALTLPTGGKAQDSDGFSMVVLLHNKNAFKGVGDIVDLFQEF